MKNLRILHVLTQRPDGTGSGVTLQALIGEARERGLSSRVVVGIPWGEESRCRKTHPAPSHPVLFEGRDVAGAVVGMSDVMPYRSRSFRDLLPGELIDRFTYEEKNRQVLAEGGAWLRSKSWAAQDNKLPQLLSS